ncbi:MAG: helix-turn-helix domain-containing protein [Acutalibacteraceae bacterium]|nr:helix-turn-helix domain-containing protein [Acutalibacteraceae bacterium]MEE1055768.1 helix-turn-helix domain-containing protein [Acutalibacteraceae bacterium]
MISENIYTLRKNKKLSQEQVAEAIGVSRQAVAKWETGDTVPDINNCIALANLFNVTLDEFVNYDSKTNYGLPIGPNGKYIFGTVTVGEKGQIVIPAKARKIFNIKPGDSIMVLGDIEQGLALINANFLFDALNHTNPDGRK